MAAAPAQLATETAQIAQPAASETGPAHVGLDQALLARIVHDGLKKSPKQLPPWLFYDEAGSLLFERITELPEYYLTRIERSLFAEHAGEMIAAASGDGLLRLIELGAGSADKTRILLAATLRRQGRVVYQPVDVSETALEAARLRLESELPAVTCEPVVADYTAEWSVADGSDAPDTSGSLAGEHKLLLWIGSSIGNFEPEAAVELLKRINQSMRPGDGLLLGVDLAPCDGGKCVGELLAAYDDEAGVTADFNRNLLVRLNRELGADFDLDAFAHCAVWNQDRSRIEMHLESLEEQRVSLNGPGPEASFAAHFAAGERLHTENSYKYTLEDAAALMAEAGFPRTQSWTDPDEWFAVLLGQKQ
jgi:dimethylhistidine N-methyltransferase